MEITMNKVIWFLLLLMITVAVAESDHDHDHGVHHHEHEGEKDGVCGKFSTERMLTHKLRHCEKAARDGSVVASPQCCKAVEKVSNPCLRAIFSSGAFKKVGVNPNVAITIPQRCHYGQVKPPKIH